MTSRKVLSYLIYNKQHRKRFITEFNGLSARAINVLKANGIDNYDQFYRDLFIYNSLHDFQGLRNVGFQTQDELLAFTRRIFDPKGIFSGYINAFDKSMSMLSARSRGILRQAGMSIFETYLFQKTISPDKKDLSKIARCRHETILELDQFDNKFCLLIGLKPTIDSDRIYYKTLEINQNTEGFRKAQSAFMAGVNDLSNETRTMLSKLNANSLQEFYNEFMADHSLLSLILNKVGPESLKEIIDLRIKCDRLLKKSIKCQTNNE